MQTRLPALVPQFTGAVRNANMLKVNVRRNPQDKLS